MYYDYFGDNKDNSLIWKTTRLFRVYNGMYGVVYALGAIMIVVSLLLIIIAMVTGNAKDRAEGKGKMSGLIMAAIVMFTLGSFMEVLIHLILSISL